MLKAVVCAVSIAGALVVCGCASPTHPSGFPATGAVSLQTIAYVPVSGPIVDATGGSVATENFSGQSVTVPLGSFSNIRFQWYLQSGEASAFGKLFVLTQEYLGLPGNLGSAPGLVGVSTSIENGQYVMPPSLTLTGPRTYWFYTDTMGKLATSFDIDPYTGGSWYNTGYALHPFSKNPASGRFTQGMVWVPPPPGVFTDANFKLVGAQQ